MPLIKIFATPAVKKLPIAALQTAMCNVWGTKPGVTKLMFSRVEDWTHSGEDVFVDIRAKGTAVRTKVEFRVISFRVAV